MRSEVDGWVAMSLCNRYYAIDEQLKMLTHSKVRAKILLCLREGAKNAGELERALGTRTTTILHAIKNMTEGGLVEKADLGSKYSLTNIGKIQALILDNLLTSVGVLDQYRNFWQSHDISGIPEELLGTIWMLGQSEIIKDDLASPLGSLENFVTELTNSKEIHGVSPFIISGFTEAIAISIRRGAKVDLILTDDILKILSKDYHDLLRELLRYENFRLYHIDLDIKVAFTVTNTLLSMGLYYKLDGNYDLGNDLICVGESAIKWGLELFEYYRNMSELIEHI